MYTTETTLASVIVFFSPMYIVGDDLLGPVFKAFLKKSFDDSLKRFKVISFGNYL